MTQMMHHATDKDRALATSATVAATARRSERGGLMNPLPTQMANHWWQRPGRFPGRRLYHWHLTFHDQPKVIELAEMAQARLNGLSGLDLVAPQWLHVTTLLVGLGHSWQWQPVAEVHLAG